MTWHQKWGGALALWENGHLIVSRQEIGIPYQYEWSVWRKTDAFGFSVFKKGYASSIDEAKMEAEIALSDLVQKSS